MKFNTTTLGCKVNLYETEAITIDLINRGWTLLNDENLDVYIINTCTVTQTSDQKSRQMIRQARRKYPNAIIVAMGCFVQTSPDSAGMLADIVIGTSGRNQIYDLVNSFVDTKNQINQIFDINDFTEYEEMKLDRLTTHTRGFIKIQDGCENFCSYCLIPYARGKIKSRQPENVIDEINKLVNLGTKEIIISGINTGTYGQDLGNINLAQLISKIMEETSLWRLRLSSIELMEITDELLSVIKKYQDRIANHLHIPLQAGSDGVLKRMKRKYTTIEYKEKIDNIRTMFPDIAITTDCLAGFVGETEEEFKEAIEFIKTIGFSDMHIFPYSRRKNTEADKMDNHLEPGLIKERAKKMIEVAKVMKDKYQQRFIEKNFDVLIEQQKNNYYVGHTTNYLEVIVSTNDTLIENEVYNCEIIEIRNNKIYAKVRR